MYITITCIPCLARPSILVCIFVIHFITYITIMTDALVTYQQSIKINVLLSGHSCSSQHMNTECPGNSYRVECV